MKKIRTPMCAVVVGLVLLVVIGRGQADETKLRNTTRPALQQVGEGGPLGTGVTYHGRLQDSGGNPITDTCDLRFSLWDAESDGSQIGSDCTLTGAPVTDGYFTATTMWKGTRYSWTPQGRISTYRPDHPR